MKKTFPAVITAILATVCLFCESSAAQETIIQYLSGKGMDDAVDWEFFCTDGRRSGEWTTIPVPSCWELHGFGKYNYGQDRYSERGMEKGIYRHSFTVPDVWKGKSVNIVFEGSMTDTEIKINGKQAGEIHQGAFYRFKHDISHLLKYGSENLLEVTVAKHSANESVNEAERRCDFWIFGGIFRPIYLEVKPPSNIERIAIDAMADGSFSMDVFLNGIRRPCIINSQILSPAGEKLGLPFSATLNRGDNSVHLESMISDIKSWSPEFPNLYTVEVSLFQGETIVHSINQTFGFRTVELRPRDGIYINGTKIKFKGVNRHSFWPSSGRTSSRQLSIDDVNMMKDMNMNAVRMSHYPPDAHFLDVCDSLGLFVLDELAGWQSSYDTEVGTRLVHEMIYSDVNHPSIVVWDNGNEGGWNPQLDHWFDELDPQHRPLIHPWQIFRNTDTQHYVDWDYGNGTHQHGTEVTFSTELLHGLYDGGHGAGLEDYWQQMWTNPLSAGGFLWAFADEGVVRTDQEGILDTDGNLAPDGIVGPYREKEGSYFAIKEIWSPVYFERRFITPQFNGRFNIENRFHYTNLKQCSFSFELKRFSGTNDTSLPEKVSGTIPSPDINPGHKGILQLQPINNIHEFDVLYITASDSYGREIFTWSWPLKLPGEIASERIDLGMPGMLGSNETKTSFDLSAGGVKISIDRSSGQLIRVANENGVFPLSQGPMLLHGESDSGNVRLVREAEYIQVITEGIRGLASQVWSLYPSGWLKLEIKYDPPYETDLMGVGFTLTEDEVKGMTLLGDGPYRVYKNRIKGTTLGLWSKEYNNTVTGEGKLVYPEFKGYYSNLYWVEVETREQPFTVVCATENIFLHMLNPELPKLAEARNAQVQYPDGGFSFLHGIPAIGTKFRTADRTGPMGNKNIFSHKGRRNHKELEIFFDFRAEGNRKTTK